MGGHGWQISGCGERGPARRVDGSCGIARARGGRPGARGAFDPFGLDQWADRRGVRRAGGHGSAVAQRFRQGRRRRVEGEHCAWAAAGEERNRAAGRRAVARPAGGRPAELDDCPPARRNRSARRRKHQPLAIIQGIAKKNFRWRRPRHTLKGRQTASEVDRIGLRLQLRKRQAEAGDIILLYGDESEALTHPYLARAWAKSGADLRVPAPGQARKVAMLGSLDCMTRQLIVHTSPTKRSSDFVAHLEQLDQLCGPMPGRLVKPVVLVEDNGPIHVSKLSRAALAARAHWLTIEWLPKYAPELNDIEVVWHDLKAHHLAHQTFTDIAALDQAIHTAVEDLNRERMVDPLAKARISA